MARRSADPEGPQPIGAEGGRPVRVLVTGVGGFVGTALARGLAAAGEEVLGTYLGAEPTGVGVNLRAADILDPPGLEVVVSEFAPERIVHLAGLSSVAESWKRPDDYRRVNVEGVENLLAAAGGRRVLLASSAEVYGRVPEDEQPITEARPVDPRNPYAESKAAAEERVLAAGGIVVRMFNVVGPGQAETFALPSFARQLAAARGGDTVLQVGNLAMRRDFLHVDDAVAGYRTLIRSGEKGGVYNLGRGEALSLRAALDLLIEVAGIAASVEVDPERLRPVDVELTLADNRRLRALGWRPERSLHEALEDLWAEVRDRIGHPSPRNAP